MASIDTELQRVYLVQRIANIQQSLDDYNIKSDDERSDAFTAIGKCQDLLSSLESGDYGDVLGAVQFFDETYGADMAVWLDNHADVRTAFSLKDVFNDRLLVALKKLCSHNDSVLSLIKYQDLTAGNLDPFDFVEPDVAAFVALMEELARQDGFIVQEMDHSTSRAVEALRKMLRRTFDNFMSDHGKALAAIWPTISALCDDLWPDVDIFTCPDLTIGYFLLVRNGAFGALCKDYGDDLRNIDAAMAYDADLLAYAR